MAENSKDDTVVDARACLLPKIRTNDAAREAATTRLSRYYADGSLTQEEFTARCDIILEAKTQVEVDVMFQDLPKQPQPRNPAPLPVKPARQRRERADPMLAFLGAMFMSTGVGIGGSLANVAWLYAAGLTLLLVSGGAAVILAIKSFSR